MGNPQSWMVYNGKSHLSGWFGGTPILGNPHMLIYITCSVFFTHTEGGITLRWILSKKMLLLPWIYCKKKNIPISIYFIQIILTTDIFFQYGTCCVFICSKPSICRWTHVVLKLILGLKPKQVPPKDYFWTCSQKLAALFCICLVLLNIQMTL